MPSQKVDKSIRDIFGPEADTLNLCMQCGLCTGLCPFTTPDGAAFSIRKSLKMAGLGIGGFEAPELLYTCSTCGRCQTFCPRGVRPPDILLAVRTIIAQTGFLPEQYRDVIHSMQTYSNPWGACLEDVLRSGRNARLPRYDTGHEFALFPCCATGYDPRLRSLNDSVVSLLQSLGISFGILPGEMTCCGEAVRRFGSQEAFEAQAKKNIERFREQGVQKIITLSPHCFHAFRQEYPTYGGVFEVVHYSQVIRESIRFSRQDASSIMRVTYHDPCYLGRHGGIFDEPRALIEGCKGVKLIELEQSGKRAGCCGGGGGKVWLNISKEERLADRIIREAVSKDVDAVVTACPYCLIMLEYSRDLLANETQRALEVLDLSELVQRSS